MVSGGTSVEVAREMGIEAHGLDLHSGFNVLKQSILEVVGKPSDLVLSHPPYHNIVVYSGNVWGRGPHPDELSRCATKERPTGEQFKPNTAPPRYADQKSRFAASENRRAELLSLRSILFPLRPFSAKHAMPTHAEHLP
jgi:hypothetical protein